MKSKNFPWRISKTNGNTIYIINERYGEASNVSIVPDKPIDEYTIYNAIDGTVIKFTCPEEEISNFRIKIKN